MNLDSFKILKFEINRFIHFILMRILGFDEVEFEDAYMSHAWKTNTTKL